jgi:flagellar biosynthetic protein FlhB
LSISLLGRAGLWFGSLLALIGGLDALYQKFDHAKRLRMTKQEVRDESKETEGNPELKSRIRQVQQQQSRQRMMEDLPKADVVVVNPSHFAVALRYDDGRMGAPRGTHYAVALKYDAEGVGAPIVVAKGVDEMALNLRKIAASHRVEIFEAPPLARALYTHVEIDEVIPAALYTAVAQVLAYVYQLKQAVAHGEEPPSAPMPEVDPDLMGPYRDQ